MRLKDYRLVSIEHVTVTRPWYFAEDLDAVRARGAAHRPFGRTGQARCGSPVANGTVVERRSLAVGIEDCRRCYSRSK